MLVHICQENKFVTYTTFHMYQVQEAVWVLPCGKGPAAAIAIYVHANLSACAGTGHAGSGHES